jgi:NADH-quinone oxidoreductase subunit L
MYIYAWLIFILPLVSFPLALFIGKYRRNVAGIIASSMIGLSLLLSIVTYFYVGANGTIYNSYHWFANIDFGIYVDNLTLIMLLMVSFVSLMIQLFSLYYMKDDPNRHVYFAETSLFTAGMLGLVESSNLVFFFLFWELVGLCSYLLIGFWFFKPNAASAAKKAFIVTRVGDLLLLIGMVLLYTTLSSSTLLTPGESPLSIPVLIGLATSPSTQAAFVSAIGPTNLGIITLLFLGGVAGKSSQFPLHVWIPDAMEGPATVSALIHAATMVTAGIYLVARIFPLYQVAPSYSLVVVAALGAFTALFSGILGVVMNDIKRILAYSTISQLGYMLAAMGLSGLIGSIGVSLGMYQLVVHAMFKALLFMSAGAIMIALMDLRSVKQMGGLWRRMPVTISLMFIGAITLAAIPPTAAFFSKDAIIAAAWEYFTLSNGNLLYLLPWIFLAVAAFLTAVYTFRMFFLVALGKPRSHLAEHAHDAPLIALIPLFFLAAFSLILGIFQGGFYNFIYPVYSALSPSSTIIYSAPGIIQYIPLILALFGILITYILYGTERWKHLDISRNALYRIVKEKFYLDYLYTRVIAERTVIPVSGSIAGVELSYNSGVEKFGRGSLSFGSFLRKMQNGLVENYFLVIILGMTLAFLVLIIGGVF